jgi:hypothetical protein
MVLGGVTMTLGSDATGDIYYRNSSGILTRLPIGSTGQVLNVASGLPAWATVAGATTPVVHIASSTFTTSSSATTSTTYHYRLCGPGAGGSGASGTGFAATGCGSGGGGSMFTSSAGAAGAPGCALIDWVL